MPCNFNIDLKHFILSITESFLFPSTPPTYEEHGHYWTILPVCSFTGEVASTVFQGFEYVFLTHPTSFKKNSES